MHCWVVHCRLQVTSDSVLSLETSTSLLGVAELSDWMERFLRVCRSRNLAKGALDFYSKKLSGFIRLCASLSIEDLQQVTPDTIRDFLLSLAEKGHKPAGVHCYYRAIRTFLRWYEFEVEPDGWKNPIRKVKAPIVPLEPLDPVSIETVKALTDTCKIENLTSSRDHSILLFLLDTGVRMAELLALNKEDVDIYTGVVVIRSGKGRKPRNVYLGDTSRHVLRRYLKKRKDFNPALWITRSGTRLKQSGLQMMLRRRSLLIGPNLHWFWTRIIEGRSYRISVLDRCRIKVNFFVKSALQSIFFYFKVITSL